MGLIVAVLLIAVVITLWRDIAALIPLMLMIAAFVILAFVAFAK
jgi:hypothetical protein